MDWRQSKSDMHDWGMVEGVSLLRIEFCKWRLSSLDNEGDDETTAGLASTRKRGFRRRVRSRRRAGKEEEQRR